MESSKPPQRTCLPRRGRGSCPTPDRCGSRRTRGNCRFRAAATRRRRLFRGALLDPAPEDIDLLRLPPILSRAGWRHSARLYHAVYRNRIDLDAPIALQVDPYRYHVFDIKRSEHFLDVIGPSNIGRTTQRLKVFSVVGHWFAFPVGDFVFYLTRLLLRKTSVIPLEVCSAGAAGCPVPDCPRARITLKSPANACGFWPWLPWQPMQPPIL